MTALWTWYIRYTPGAEIDVARTDASDLIEVSKIDTQIVSMYVSDRDVALIRRANRDTGEEFFLLDRRIGGLFSEWLGPVLGAPPETATVATVGGPVASGSVPVISPPSVGAPTQIAQQTVEAPPIVAQRKSGVFVPIAVLIIAVGVLGMFAFPDDGRRR